MSTRIYKIKPGQQWQPLCGPAGVPDAITSVTNTSPSGTLVAVNVNNQTKSLKPNECVKLNGAFHVHAIAQNGHGQVTCELPD